MMTRLHPWAGVSSSVPRWVHLRIIDLELILLLVPRMVIYISIWGGTTTNVVVVV